MNCRESCESPYFWNRQKPGAALRICRIAHHTFVWALIELDSRMHTETTSERDQSRLKMKPTSKVCRRVHEHYLIDKEKLLTLVNRRPSFLIYSLCFTILLSFYVLCASNSLRFAFNSTHGHHFDQRNSLVQPGNGKLGTHRSFRRL